MSNSDNGWREDKVLIAVHEGTSAHGSKIALFMGDHCLPIAVAGEPDIAGFYDLWSESMDVEEFFGALGFQAGEAITLGRPFSDEPTNGLWVFETEWHDDDVGAVPDDEDIDGDRAWFHLAEDMTIRRPTPEELARLAKGEAPWDGGIVL